MNLIEFSDKYQTYLSDESNRQGTAEWIVFPKNKKELIQTMKIIQTKQMHYTVQGARTGLQGDAVPRSGAIINLSEYQEICDVDTLKCQLHTSAGITLDTARKRISEKTLSHPLFLPLDPTEENATLGGIIASNAYGLSSMVYGDAQHQMMKTSCINQDGTEVMAYNGHELKKLLKDGAVISEVWFPLRERSPETWGITTFFSDDTQLFRFMESLSAIKEEIALSTIEYLNQVCLEMIKTFYQITQHQAILNIPTGTKSIVYMELSGTEEAIEESAEKIIEIADYCVIPEEKMIVFDGIQHCSQMRSFRHTVVEAINLYIKDRKIKKNYIYHEDKFENFSKNIKNFQKEAQEKQKLCMLYGNPTHLYIECYSKKND